MNYTATEPDQDVYHNLQWLMFLRVVFTTLLLGSSIVFQLRTSPSPVALPLLILYGLIATIFLLSFLYVFLLKRIQRKRLFAFVQISIDTLMVSLIIFVTGGFSSIFSFLYLLVVIYGSLFFFRRGSLVTAAFCSIQYGVLVDLEYFGFLTPFGAGEGLTAANYQGIEVFYKILITMAACFTVALLSSMLSEREKETQRELAAIQQHVKRVEKLAAMGELAAGIAHEIKNPLASLSGATQLLLYDMEVQPEHFKLMQIIHRETDRLSLLINDFLMFARPPMGQNEPIELEGALKETLMLFAKDSACSARISIREDFLPGTWIDFDPTHLRQILWNLLLNAAEAIESKGEIGIKMFLVKHRKVGIEINDSGCGIPAQRLPSIFNPFYTSKPNGTGLGLSIVHNILDAYESRLDVESREGGGTRFTFILNRIDPPRV